MCGIAGIVNLDGSPASKGVLERMVDIQRYRGPDDKGFFLSGPSGLGHARLSIIDLSREAAQPMVSVKSGMVVVHNGEIYNYRELRDELARLGYAFQSKSDTEVILHAYEEWGEDCLRRFNGMWAFAIYDPQKSSLFCSRDRFGVKPFYYYLDGSKFVFASEIKALLEHPGIKAEPNDTTIFNYLASGYGYMDTSEETFFAGIRQLKAGNFISLSLRDNKFSQYSYWEPPSEGAGRNISDDELTDRFRSLFEDSIRLRLRSDVPLGVALSGGLDSSSIACVAAGLMKESRLEAFSSCFEDEKECDETAFIRPVIEKTRANPHYIFAKPEKLFDEIETIIWHQDEPYSTLSIFPQWYVMKLAGQSGVKVLLTGQGGDEALAGYHKYYLYLFADLIRSFRLSRAAREIKKYGAIKGSSRGIAMPVAKIMLSHIVPDVIKDEVIFTGRCRPESCLSRDFAAEGRARIRAERKYSSILNNELYNAFRISPLPSLLHVDDRSSMAHSVESRAPFLDYRIVEFLFSIGPEHKIRDGITKHILRKSMDGILPDEVRGRTDKMGFSAPLARWFAGGLKGKVHEILSSKEFGARPYFDQDKALKRFKRFADGVEPDAHLTIWSWVNLELWLRRFIDRGNR